MKNIDNIVRNSDSFKIRYNSLYADFVGNCRHIADDLTAEGKPSSGSDYELQCKALWEDYYVPAIEEIAREEAEERTRHLFTPIGDLVDLDIFC